MEYICGMPLDAFDMDPHTVKAVPGAVAYFFTIILPDSQSPILVRQSAGDQRSEHHKSMQQHAIKAKWIC
jgi:hypothetical protein